MSDEVSAGCEWIQLWRLRMLQAATTECRAAAATSARPVAPHCKAPAARASAPIAAAEKADRQSTPREAPWRQQAPAESEQRWQAALCREQLQRRQRNSGAQSESVPALVSPLRATSGGEACGSGDDDSSVCRAAAAASREAMANRTPAAEVACASAQATPRVVAASVETAVRGVG